MLVTGAAGLYGVHLVDALVRRQDVERVIAVDNFSRHFDVPDPFLPSDEAAAKVQLHRRRFQDLTTHDLNRWEVDAVIHLAAYVSIDESMEQPWRYFQNNEQGTFHLARVLMASERRPVLIYASSPEVYGAPRYVPLDEDHPSYPKSVYAVTKLAAEKHCQSLYQWYGYPVIIIRNFNTFGENQNTAGHAAVIPSFIAKALGGQPLTIQGEGTQTRDFMYVKDAVRAYCQVLDGRDRLAGQTLNIGTGTETSIESLARIIIDLTGSPSSIVKTKARQGDLPRLLADISRIKALTGWEPQYTLTEGLRRTIAWYEKFLGRSPGSPISGPAAGLEQW